MTFLHSSVEFERCVDHTVNMGPSPYGCAVHTSGPASCVGLTGFVSNSCPKQHKAEPKLLFLSVLAG